MKKLFLLSLSLLCCGVAYAQAQEAFPFVAKIAAKTANLRAGQNTNFESLGQLKSGDEIIVVGSSFDWRKVKLPIQAKAFVNAGFVKDLGEGVGEVTGNRLNIRAAALANASIIGQLKKGELVRIIEKKEDWYHIEPPDQSFGWILKDFIVFQTAQIPPARQVAAPIRNIYLKKRLAAAQFPELPPGQILATGVIANLGDKAVSADIRHYLQSEGRVYALQGYRHIIDGFLDQKVKIEGKINPDYQLENPVVLVTKIALVL